jgi:hypothetical protein
MSSGGIQFVRSSYSFPLTKNSLNMREQLIAYVKNHSMPAKHPSSLELSLFGPSLPSCEFQNSVLPKLVSAMHNQLSKKITCASTVVPCSFDDYQTSKFETS